MFSPFRRGFTTGTPAPSHVRPIGDSKLTVSVRVYLVCLCVEPAMNWRPVHGVLCLSGNDSWDVSTPITMNRIR